MIILGIRQLQGTCISPRPRNYAVPSCRPNQRTGYVIHPQLVPGSGEGQNLSKEPKGTLCKIQGAGRTANQSEGIPDLCHIIEDAF